MTDLTRYNAILSGLTDIFNKIDVLRKPQMERDLTGFSLSEIAVIEAIAALDKPNVTKLASSLFVTKGAISKITKKLAVKGLTETFQLDGNKKEIYFRLTESGIAVNNRHEALHAQFLASDAAVFEELTDAELTALEKFTKNYNEHLENELKKDSQ